MKLSEDELHALENNAFILKLHDRTQKTDSDEKGQIVECADFSITNRK